MGNSINFLRRQGLLKPGNNTFTIEGDFGVISLTDLLDEYALSKSQGMYTALMKVNDVLMFVDNPQAEEARDIIAKVLKQF